MHHSNAIYLLHGFASAPKYPSEKAQVLEQVFELPVKQLCYESGSSFQDNLKALITQVDIAPLFFVGTSLGAFYASRLAEYFRKQTAMPIMLNPCHNPFAVLKGMVGTHKNFVSGSPFELTDKAVASYRDVPFIDTSIVMPRWILLNRDDELLDALETEDLYRDKLEIMTFEHGGHRFENIVSPEVTSALERINNTYWLNGLTSD
ncbi:MAG TPA: YqiA/YcfP family alpha/beta fold hydrolase [Anaerolineales bacterium]|nr:YqiA/YcfP family alpha/beta fold hydrolase [Anaerolineales bacterium]